jgi:hypothetical protein
MKKRVKKTRSLLSAAAVAASSFPALASAPVSAPPVERPAFPVAVGATGLTAGDLIVGLDGRLGFEVKAHGAKAIVVGDTATNNGC